MDPFVGSLITTGISSIFGGLSGQAEADAQNRAIEAQYNYNLQNWKYGKKRIKADYRQEKKQWELNKQNEETLANWKDLTANQDWQYALKIQDFEYRSQLRQYQKSEQLYGQQLTFNKMAQQAAEEAERRRLEDAVNEIAFQNQDLVIKSLESEGAAAVKGQQGRSAAKGDQSVVAALGRNQAILAESLISARGETEAAMKKIAADKYGADLAAQAARMLKPERAPAPPKPITTPRAEFLKPRKPKAFDFGAKPIKGAMASSAGAWLGAAGNLATGIAGAAISSGKSSVGSFDINSISANPYGYK